MLKGEWSELATGDQRRCRVGLESLVRLHSPDPSRPAQSVLLDFRSLGRRPVRTVRKCVRGRWLDLIGLAAEAGTAEGA